jgi:DNA-binding transcriptional MerR regulator
MYREAGVPLEQIRNLLNSSEEDSSRILGKRLKEINREIRYLRLQQNILVEMLKSANASDGTELPDKDTLVAILQSAGLDDDRMNHFHRLFEQNRPDAHQLFLEYLGIPEEEIERIRESSRSMEQSME